MLRYAVIGLKGIGQYHLKWAMKNPDAKVVAVCDIDKSVARETAMAHQLNYYTDYRDMLSSESLDVVSIALPHRHLVSVGIDCLKHGCHILLEKPLARHIGEARQLLDVAKQNHLQVGVAYQYRTFATPRKLKAIINSNQIGDIKHVHWTWHELRPNSYFDRAEWRTTWDGAGGGLLMNQISHDIDLLRWLIGEVHSVTAQVTNHLQRTYLEDALACTLTFSNGALGTLTASINHSTGYNTRQILGTKGLIVIPSPQSLATNPNDKIMLGLYDQPIMESILNLEGHHQQPHTSWKTLYSIQSPSMSHRVGRKLKQGLSKFTNKHQPDSKPTSGHGSIIWNFIRSTKNLESTLVSGEDAYKTLELLNAILTSSLTKKHVSLPLDIDQYTELYGALLAKKLNV